MEYLQDEQHCRLRNFNGSECGTCSCEGPRDCPNPPQHTPIAIRLNGIIEQWLAKRTTN